MDIRRFRRQRSLAWLAIFAMLLLALVPTVSQLAASTHRLPFAAFVHAQDHAAHHAHHSADGKAHPGDEDCWRKCGYCDFLTHAPALGTFAAPAILTAARPSAPAVRPLAEPRYARPIRAAQPRGPPGILA